jgi:hypothetical protein
MELELLRQQYNLKLGNIRRWFEEDETFSDWTGKQNFGGGFWVHFFLSDYVWLSAIPFFPLTCNLFTLLYLVLHKKKISTVEKRTKQRKWQQKKMIKEKWKIGVVRKKNI